ncbi:hypothetical protein BAQ48_07740 [Bacillus luti]|uniref:hypothetical protein n=1 Tax=Bacillus luti TaxID=2026191 RepID=UPI0008FDC150|nr:hypothetical protein [Bacillus luti]OJE52721.1 hypothetical protein BAQ48_07740 [Bacillus luti]
MNNTNISLENQDIISDIDEILPKLERMQGKYEVREDKKKLEDEPWKKRYDKASSEFYHRSKAMLDISTFFDLKNTKNHAILAAGIYLSMCIFIGFPEDQFFSFAFGYILLTFFIWVPLVFVIIEPINKILNIKIERRKEQNRKELEEIKKREYPILFENKPSYVYMEEQREYTQQEIEPLKKQYPEFKYILYASYGFSDTIDRLQYVRYVLASGQAQTLDIAEDMMFDRCDAQRAQREARIYGNNEPIRAYLEEKRRKEEAEYQQSREEYARREAQETAWLQEQDRKRQQALIDEDRMNIAGMATHARQNGKDRATVRMYDDMLDRSYHERLDEDRTYEYGKDDKASDIGGGGL